MTNFYTSDFEPLNRTMTTLTAPKKTAELPQYGSRQYDSMLNQCEKTQKHAPAQSSAAVCRLLSAVSKCRLLSLILTALLFYLLFGEIAQAQTRYINYEWRNWSSAYSHSWQTGVSPYINYHTTSGSSSGTSGYAGRFDTQFAGYVGQSSGDGWTVQLTNDVFYYYTGNAPMHGQYVGTYGGTAVYWSSSWGTGNAGWATASPNLGSLAPWNRTSQVVNIGSHATGGGNATFTVNSNRPSNPFYYMDAGIDQRGSGRAIFTSSNTTATYNASTFDGTGTSGDSRATLEVGTGATFQTGTTNFTNFNAQINSGRSWTASGLTTTNDIVHVNGSGTFNTVGTNINGNTTLSGGTTWNAAQNSGTTPTLLQVGASSTGTLNVGVAGTGTEVNNLNTTGETHVGVGGTGVINMNQAARWTSDDVVRVGRGSTGTINVNNTSIWTADATINVGDTTQGTVNIRDASRVVATDQIVNIGVGGVGEVNQSGSSSWANRVTNVGIGSTGRVNQSGTSTHDDDWVRVGATHLGTYVLSDSAVWRSAGANGTHSDGRNSTAIVGVTGEGIVSLRGTSSTVRPSWTISGNTVATPNQHNEFIVGLNNIGRVYGNQYSLLNVQNGNAIIGQANYGFVKFDSNAQFNVNDTHVDNGNLTVGDTATGRGYLVLTTAATSAIAGTMRVGVDTASQGRVLITGQDTRQTVADLTTIAVSSNAGGAGLEGNRYQHPPGREEYDTFWLGNFVYNPWGIGATQTIEGQIVPQDAGRAFIEGTAAPTPYPNTAAQRGNAPTLAVADGGQLISNNRAIVAQNANSYAYAVVDDRGDATTRATWHVTAASSPTGDNLMMTMGQSGDAYLRVLNGGRVLVGTRTTADGGAAGMLGNVTHRGNMVIAQNGTSEGTVRVNGSGNFGDSLLDVTGNLTVAQNTGARGNLYVYNRGDLNVGTWAMGTDGRSDMTIAQQVGTYGRTHLDGAGTTGSVTGTLTVGFSGNAGQLYEYQPSQVAAAGDRAGNVPDVANVHGVNPYNLYNAYDGSSLTDQRSYAAPGTNTNPTLPYPGYSPNAYDNRTQWGGWHDSSNMLASLTGTDFDYLQRNMPGLAVTDGAYLRTGRGVVASERTVNAGATPDVFSVGYVVIDGMAQEQVGADLVWRRSTWDVVGVSGTTASSNAGGDMYLTVAKDGNAYVRVLDGGLLRVGIYDANTTSNTTIGNPNFYAGTGTARTADMEVAVLEGVTGTVRVSGVHFTNTRSTLEVARDLFVSRSTGLYRDSAAPADSPWLGSRGNMYLYDGALMTVGRNYVLGDGQTSLARQHVDGPGTELLVGLGYTAPGTTTSVYGTLTVGKNGAAAGWYQENRYDHRNWDDDEPDRFDHYYDADPRVWFDSRNTLEDLYNVENARTGNLTGNMPGLAITRGASVRSGYGMVGEGSLPPYDPESIDLEQDGYMSNGYVLIDHKNYNHPTNLNNRMDLRGFRTEWQVSRDLTISQDGTGFVRVLNGGLLEVGSVPATDGVPGRTIIGHGTWTFPNDITNLEHSDYFMKGSGTLHVIGNEAMTYTQDTVIANQYRYNPNDGHYYRRAERPILLTDGSLILPVYRDYREVEEIIDGKVVHGYARHQPIRVVDIAEGPGSFGHPDGWVANLIDPTRLTNHRDMLGYISPHGYYVAAAPYGARSEWISHGATILGYGTPQAGGSYVDPVTGAVTPIPAGQEHEYYNPSQGTIRIDDGGYGETHGLYIGLERGTEGMVSVSGRASELHVFEDATNYGTAGPPKPEGRSLFSASNSSLVWLHGNAELRLNGNAMVSKGAILHLDSMLNPDLRSDTNTPVIFDAMEGKATFVDARIEGDGIVTGESGVFVTQTREGLYAARSGDTHEMVRHRMEIEPGQMYMWNEECENPNYYGTLTFGDMFIMTGNALTSFDVNGGFWDYSTDEGFSVEPLRDSIIVRRGADSGSTGRVYASLSGELQIHARLTDYYGVMLDPETGLRTYSDNVSFVVVETVGDHQSGDGTPGNGHAGTIVRQYDTLTVRPHRFFNDIGQRIVTREQLYQEYGGPVFVLDRDVNEIYDPIRQQYNDQLLVANMTVKEDPFEENGRSYNQRQTGIGLDQIYALRDERWLPVLRAFWYVEDDEDFQRTLSLFSGEVRAHTMFMPVTDMWRFAYNRHDFRPCPERARWMNPCYALYSDETFCDGNTGCDSNGNKTQPWQNHWNRIKRTVDAVKKDSVPWVSYIGDTSITRTDGNALITGPESFGNVHVQPMRIIRDGMVVGFDKPFLRPGSYLGLQAAYINADLNMYRAGAKSDDIQFGVYHGTILNNRWEWKNYLGMGVQDYRMWRTLDKRLAYMEAVPEHNTFYCYTVETDEAPLTSRFVGYTMSLNTEIAHPFLFQHTGKGKCGTTGRNKQYVYMLRPYGSLDVQGVWQSAASESWGPALEGTGDLIALDYRRTNHVRAYARYGFSAEWHNDNRLALRGGLAHAFLIGGRGYADVDNQFQFRKEETSSFNIRSTNGGNSYGLWNAGGSIFLFKDRSGTLFADYMGRADLRTVTHGVQVGFQKRY